MDAGPASGFAEPPPDGVVAPGAGATITGTVWETTAAHCGGARVQPGQPASRRLPWSGQRLAIVRGTQNDGSPAFTVTATDAAGRFAVALPAGTWCFVEPGKVGPATGTAGPHTDAACLAAERRRCEAVVEVPKATSPVTIELIRRCFGPCYRGPPPPAARSASLAPACLRQRTSYEYRCSGMAPRPGEPDGREVKVCDQCLTDADCAVQPGGRCMEVGGQACAGPARNECRYPSAACGGGICPEPEPGYPPSAPPRGR